MIRLVPAKISGKVIRELMSSNTLWTSQKNVVKEFKETIRDQMYVSQSQRCAYCMGRFVQPKQHRDHIAPKGTNLHPQWAYHPWNIVLSCYDCNSIFKGETDTVVTSHYLYRKVEFAIVHPYLDEPGDHIRFKGHHSGVLIQAIPGSAKGANTIKMFDLASANRTKQRARERKEDNDLKKLTGTMRVRVETFLSSADRLIAKIRS